MARLNYSYQSKIIW